jgi:hypothetical protein
LTVKLLVEILVIPVRFPEVTVTPPLKLPAVTVADPVSIFVALIVTV